MNMHDSAKLNQKYLCKNICNAIHNTVVEIIINFGGLCIHLLQKNDFFLRLAWHFCVKNSGAQASGGAPAEEFDM